MDAEIGRVTTEFIEKLNDYFSGKFFYKNYISLKFDADKFLRAMIGHLLAATSVKDCMKPIVDSPFYTPLRNFVLGRNPDIGATHNITIGFIHSENKLLLSQLHSTIMDIIVYVLAYIFPNIFFGYTEGARNISYSCN